MSNEIIYPQFMPYVYLGIKPDTDEFYWGSRWANATKHKRTPECNFIHFYRTSAPEITAIFDSFDWFIFEEFVEPDDAYDFEQLCIFEDWDNPLILNKVCHYGAKARFRPDTKSQKLAETTMAKINPETGTSIKQDAHKKSVNTKSIINPETGTSIYCVTGKKFGHTMAVINPETGTSIAQDSAKKAATTTSAINPKTGNTFAKDSNKLGVATMRLVNPETGFTYKEEQNMRTVLANRKVDPVTGLNRLEQRKLSRVLLV